MAGETKGRLRFLLIYILKRADVQFDRGISLS